MDLKKWKEFSDKVDKENKRRAPLHKEAVDKMWNSVGNSKRFKSTNAKATKYRPIEKTEINFYEWSVGKLKI